MRILKQQVFEASFGKEFNPYKLVDHSKRFDKVEREALRERSVER